MTNRDCPTSPFDDRAVLWHDPSVNRYEFNLHLSPEQYLDYYRGTAQHILVRSAQGLTVQFPASLLQKFVTEDGIHGRFVLTCDDHHKCIDLQRFNPTL